VRIASDDARLMLIRENNLVFLLSFERNIDSTLHLYSS
jgi:hypothetical protein